MPRALHVEPDRKILTEQPMSREQMGPEVIRQYNYSPALFRCRIEMRSADNGEHCHCALVRNSIQEHVSRTPKDVVAGELAADSRQIPLALKYRSTLCDCIVEGLPYRRAQPVFQPANSRNTARRNWQGQRSKDR
jgi:hypothetical protein